MSYDLISRAEAIEAIENTDWYHQNQNKDMVSGANDDEHQAWYKAQDIYKALETVPSADRPRDGDLISRQDATSIPVLPKEHRKVFRNEDDAFETGWNEALACVNMLPSADRPRGEWIPVSERLPSENKAVLICDTGGNCFVGKLVLTDYGYKWSAPLCVVWVDIEDGDAWMPLPEPHKGGADMRGEDE